MNMKKMFLKFLMMKELSKTIRTKDCDWPPEHVLGDLICYVGICGGGGGAGEVFLYVRIIAAVDGGV